MRRKLKADNFIFRRLWGNPKHLSYVSSQLREKHPEDTLAILAAKRNSGSFTYDGIELGGERVAQEIEDTLEDLARAGHKIRKISVIGYSLGGLVARYAIGLLQAKGIFDRIQPVNFTTFASPHLGVRTPLKGVQNHIWNVLGARLLSKSGRQLFMIDSFRNTGRPLLSVLADPDSIFIRGLERFKNKSLYANVVNDRSTVFYTTAISRIDPFVQPDDLDITYLKDYDPVILDPDAPVTYKKKELPTFFRRVAGTGQTAITQLPLVIVFAILIPIGTVLFLVNSGVQTVRSQKRIRLHEEGSKDESSGFGIYRVPVMVQDMRSAVEDVFENINAGQSNEYLSGGSEEITGELNSPRSKSAKMPEMTSILDSSNDDLSTASTKAASTTTNEKTRHPSSEFPTLALTKLQFDMINTLDSVGFRKYPVFIHKVRHSHAAMIVRMNRSSFGEGKVVVSHWLEKGFEI